MEPILVEEDMVLFMILLQQLARRLRAIPRNPLHIELRLLRSLKMDLRRGSHSSQLPSVTFLRNSMYRSGSRSSRVAQYGGEESFSYMNSSGEHLRQVLHPASKSRSARFEGGKSRMLTGSARVAARRLFFDKDDVAGKLKLAWLGASASAGHELSKGARGLVFGDSLAGQHARERAIVKGRREDRVEGEDNWRHPVRMRGARSGVLDDKTVQGRNSIGQFESIHIDEAEGKRPRRRSRSC